LLVCTLPTITSQHKILKTHLLDTTRIQKFLSTILFLTLPICNHRVNIQSLCNPLSPSASQMRDLRMAPIMERWPSGKLVPSSDKSLYNSPVDATYIEIWTLGEMQYPDRCQYRTQLFRRVFRANQYVTAMVEVWCVVIVKH
jgi:hypothetical protein